MDIVNRTRWEALRHGTIFAPRKAKKNLTLIDPNSTDNPNKNLLETTHRLCRLAGLTLMPEIGIYKSSCPNGSANGRSNRIRISSGALNPSFERGLEGLLAHEVAHIVNRDTMNNIYWKEKSQTIDRFKILPIAALAFICAARLSPNKQRLFSFYYSIIAVLFGILFKILDSLLVAYYSRFKEFRADKGGAILVGKEKMIATLKLIDSIKKPSSRRYRILALFAIHPSIEQRIRRLQAEFPQ